MDEAAGIPKRGPFYVQFITGVYFYTLQRYLKDYEEAALEMWFTDQWNVDILYYYYFDFTLLELYHSDVDFISLHYDIVGLIY